MGKSRAKSATGTAAIEAVQSIVRGAGLRCTAARLAVMQHLLGTHGPETHAEVSEALADKGFDRATIYRNLTELTEAGLVSRVELGDHVWRFEVRRHAKAGTQGEDHPHFLCTSCGEVSCLEDVNVAITPKPGSARGQSADSPGPQRPGRGKPSQPRGIRSVTEVLLKGQCGNCGDEPQAALPEHVRRRNA
jgi:Fur family ferric uptake transcriptional regulator